MKSLDRELALKTPYNMNLDTYAAQFFTTAADASRKAANQLLNGTAKATITSITDHHRHQSPAHIQSVPQYRSAAIGNQFLQKLGETLFGFGSAPPQGIHHTSYQQQEDQEDQSFADIPLGRNMDLLRNHIVIDSADFNAVASSDLQQQLEYDKFMNEIWIGIVLTLIIISLVFCICSCFLYHQFRQWKRNYRHNLRQALDIESVKLNPDADDPVPEYTLVSGLPSYEAALELMQKSPNSLLPVGGGSGGTNSISSCLIVYPSLFNVFSRNEKDSCGKSSLAQSPHHGAAVTTSVTDPTAPQSPSIGGGGAVIASPTSAPSPAPAPALAPPAAAATTAASLMLSQNVKCQNVSRLVLHSIPSYEEATGCQPQQQHHLQPHHHPHHRHHQLSSDTSTCLMKSPSWCEDTTRVLLTGKKELSPLMQGV